MPASTKQLKTRIRSVSSTMHITKAMELVASSKLRRATSNMEAGRPYFSALLLAMSSLSEADSVFSKRREVKNSCYIVIAGDRGLAGGYNNNVYKLLKSESDGKNASVIPIGKRAVEYASKHGYNVIDKYESVENIDLTECADIGKKLKSLYENGDIDEVFIIYTKYVSMLSQTATVQKLLPLEKNSNMSGAVMLFEPSAEAVIAAAIPEYISGMTYGAVCESYASELSARRTAMDSASKNASEMIDSLGLKYNRARQSAITQEITEIIGGSGMN